MWDQRFDTPEYIYGKEPNDFLASNATHIPPGKVLSLGEGEGRNGTYLASLGYEVVAIDQSTVGLAKIQQLAQERQVKITTTQANLADFTIIPEAWEGIISIFCHLPSGLRTQLYPQIVRGLKPGGIFLMEGFAPEQLQYDTGGPKNIDLLPTLISLQQELQGLDWEIAKVEERDLIEGKYHNGKAVVIQLLGRKY